MDKFIKTAIILLILLSLISLLTKFYGPTDSKDYASVAKFFAGEYAAKIRTSHSLLYGFIHAPLIKLFKSFWLMKLTSLLWLALLIISIYYLSGKNRKTLLLIVASPVVWYIGPWISSIQLSSLLFLWGFFFIRKYEKTLNKKYLFYSGVLFGLSWAFWNSVVFFLFFFIITFFYNKNVNHIALFLISILVGFFPLLIFDYLVYNFPFYSTIKFLFGAYAVTAYGGIYNGTNLLSSSIFSLIIFIIMMPFFSYVLILKKIFSENKRSILFLIFGFAFFLVNPQIRYLLFLWPILIIYLGKNLNDKQFKIQLIIFFVLSLLVVAPYVIQTKYSTNSPEFSSFIYNFGRWEINSTSTEELILQEDMQKISSEHSDETFVIGPNDDDYAYLAMIYWGHDVKEFVSIQDYNLYFQNKSDLFEKKIIFRPKIKDRRQIWLGGGIQKNENDNTNYEKIKFAIGVGEPVNLENFKLVKKYNILYLSRTKSS